jgi:hypothetical protein
MVTLIEIDVVRAQPAQRAVDRVEDVLAGEPAVPRPIAHRAEALRGHHTLVPAPFEPAPEDRFRPADGVEPAAERIDVRRVEERDPTGRGAIEDRARRRLVALEPERHGAEADPGDRETGTAEACMAHGPNR